MIVVLPILITERYRVSRIRVSRDSTLHINTYKVGVIGTRYNTNNFEETYSNRMLDNKELTLVRIKQRKSKLF